MASVVRWTNGKGERKTSERMDDWDASVLAHRLEARYHYRDVKKVSV